MNDAMERYRRRVGQFPDNELARFSLARACFDAALFAEAREQFALVLARKPDWMVAQILLGKCDLSLGRTAAAKAAFARARQLAIEQHHEGPLAEMDQALAELA